MRVCKRCGDELPPAVGRGRPKLYCGRPTCGTDIFICNTCGVESLGYPGKVYCSTECRLAGMSKRNRSDPDKQKERGLKGGATVAKKRRGTGSIGYVKENGRHQHRVVAERVLGRELRPSEVVHHENLDKHDNRPNNLIVFPSQSEHARHHKLNHLLTPCNCQGIRLGELDL